MQEKICCFCGHRQILDMNFTEIIKKNIIDLVENEEVTTFYSGGMGNFDNWCEKIVNIERERKYSYLKLCLVVPYMNKKINTLQPGIYDEIIVPDLENVYYKRSIIMRNRWMAENSDIMLCGVKHDYGGAYQMMKYAEKLGIKIVKCN